MVTVYDVEANKVIQKTAQKLKELGLEKPAFVDYVKSGSHAERPPEDPNFWYVRCASLLRQAYVSGVIGTRRLRRHYGGKKKRGVKAEHHKPAGGSIIRRGMQALEKLGLLMKAKKGRKLSAAGRKLLDGVAKEVA